MPSVSDFLTPASLQSYHRERQRDEEQQACVFLRRAFAARTALLNDEELLHVVRFGLAHAEQRGIRNMRDRQRYLIPVMIWGSFFELDPQYRAALSRCWWIDSKDRRTNSTHVSAVIAEIDQLNAEIVEDSSDMRRPVKVLAELYRDHTGQMATRALFVDAMEKCWPRRFKLLQQRGIDSYLTATDDVLRRYELRSVDAVAYMCLAMFFGFRFADDPRFPWARTALRPDGRTDEERRLALGKAVLAYWRATRPEEA